MKNILPYLILLTSFGAASPVLADVIANTATDVGGGYYIGQSAFPFGDKIEITSVEHTADALVVKGHYELVSAESAQLALFTTTPTATPVPTAPTQTMQINKGRGDFELTDPNLVAGMNHVTMYSIPGGNAFAGVYFGTQEEAAQESALDLSHYGQTAASAPPAPSEAPATNSDGSIVTPNQILMNYLGEPVPPPANMDARYTTEGLSNAVQVAAQNAGITFKQLAIDDSEFPFLIEVVCGGSDFMKLKNELKKMEGYQYNGSIGNDSNSDGTDTCNVFSLVPFRSYPAGTSHQIYHRLQLRQQVFFDKANQEKWSR